ncbi:16S rRNA (adenine(1518)-N(6)/adenine(1519)-N(6))-dimethyltransferase RsmA [Varunaivibrio sulfuroxidans]|uniref:Ribosomal RNA small subunit methyltransferase A n=1 Tax=Varunaivibrio sulfuroxidans TaxID=1773489 RepID=A0A4R3J2S3_9PROT|nr:16S rRNA (adenine(1518)-N(6)/adenine(1519)-N(6))-dimethyltransferase RsmA [Varunaivibrio sulfuroxidans]TCS60119.1 dimethyladenosine transferase [Varunaivibrio sulfuroxidans]WES30907.1 16S rRNA (adenine(1518)-N(6)/adenine(1519)-N(6))-dimethyltransferase RsmA [Varunaivibrio sulfuroxidans]
MSGVSFDGLPPLKEIIHRHELSARKALGQNFLLDLNLTARIARTAGIVEGDCVIEIGPGPGGLSRAILAGDAARLIAVERDPRCIQALDYLKEAHPRRFEVIAGDATEIEVWTLGDAPRRIVANLPYNVATVLLIGWLRHARAFRSMTLMFQKEVADRLLARPRTKAYGRLSVMCQWLCAISPAFTIPPSAFTPPPKVVSSVVHLVPRDAPLGEASWAAMEKVTAAAFGQRRKMLRASLKAIGLTPHLKALGIEETARAEELDVIDFCALARVYETLAPPSQK